MTTSERLFPYMSWAQTEAFARSYCLAASGMPAPPDSVLGLEGPPDLAPAPLDARPALEARLGELFGVDPERVLVTLGATGAMHLVAMGFFPGARVVTEIPSYEPFRALSGLYAQSTGILTRQAADGFRLPLEAAAALLAPRPGQRGPSHLFLCSPHNPTGVVSSERELIDAAQLAQRSGGVLISNEAYMEFAPPAERFHAFELADNALSIGTLTKAYGLGALRTGWIVLGEGLRAEREHLVDLSYLVTVDPPTPSLRAATAALGRLDALLQPVRTYEHESRPHLVRWLEETQGVEGTVGRYGLTAFPRIAGVDDTRALVRFLGEEHNVTAVPGEFFACPGHLRIGFGVPEASLQEGLARLARGIAAFRSRAG